MGRCRHRGYRRSDVNRGRRRERSQLLSTSTYSAPGDLRQDPGRAAESPAEARTSGTTRTSGTRSRDMRVFSTYGSRGDVEPLLGPAVWLPALGAAAARRRTHRRTTEPRVQPPSWAPRSRSEVTNSTSELMT